jgi:photosystem II stability/assembly factor-like uncharacterized protein
LILPALLLLASGSWVPQQSGSEAELRGVAVVDATHAWASGAGGTVLRTRDGEHWEKVAVPGGEALDFRDAEALDASRVVLMSAGPGDASRIYRSGDAGAHWTLAHTNPDADGFYDAIAFWDARHGLVLGDPVKGRFQVRVTGDGGTTWAAIGSESMPPALEGEGGFAAGGTCLTARAGGREAWFVTGGARVSRVFRTADFGRTWSVAETPVPAGKASAGLFSVAFLDGSCGFVAGGDYKDARLAALNGARTEDGGRTWLPAPIAPSGFMSAVVAVPKTPADLVAVGLAGSAISRDAGRTWVPLGESPLNAVAFADARTGWAVGPKGTVVRFGASAAGAALRLDRQVRPAEDLERGAGDGGGLVGRQEQDRSGHVAGP